MFVVRLAKIDTFESTFHDLLFVPIYISFRKYHRICNCYSYREEYIYTKKLFTNYLMKTNDISFSIVSDVSIETIEKLSLQ